MRNKTTVTLLAIMVLVILFLAYVRGYGDGLRKGHQIESEATAAWQQTAEKWEQLARSLSEGK